MIELEAGRARVVYARERGGRLVSLTVDGLDLRWPDALTVTLETACPDLVVFTEPDHAICVEPQTHPPDALNFGPAIVAPGEPFVASCTRRWSVA